MKTNYAQHLAWFQHTVQPHVMTRDSQGTRCWYPTLKRPVIPFEQWREDNMHNPEVTPPRLSNPQKRPRVQESTPPINNTQDGEQSSTDLVHEKSCIPVTSSTTPPNTNLMINSTMSNNISTIDEPRDDTTTIITNEPNGETPTSTDKLNEEYTKSKDKENERDTTITDLLNEDNAMKKDNENESDTTITDLLNEDNTTNTDTLDTNTGLLNEKNTTNIDEPNEDATMVTDEFSEDNTTITDEPNQDMIIIIDDQEDENTASINESTIPNEPVQNTDTNMNETTSIVHINVVQPSSSMPTEKKVIESVLYRHFKFKAFIPNQFEAIHAALQQQDIFILLPSGPPRNLCYQLPILIQDPKAVTVVLVPSLTHLMKKDDYTLNYHHIPSLFVCKSKKATHKKNWQHRNQLTMDLLSRTRLLYMTFEDFTHCRLQIQTLYQQRMLARFIIDEAHCISQWGTDCHFGYLRATEGLKSDYPGIPITALTAISNHRIHLDIIRILKLKNCQLFKKSILL